MSPVVFIVPLELVSRVGFVFVKKPLHLIILCFVTTLFVELFSSSRSISLVRFVTFHGFGQLILAEELFCSVDIKFDGGVNRFPVSCEP